MIPFKKMKGQSLTVPFTAQKLGEYGVRVGISDWANLLNTEQIGWLVSNRIDK